MSNITDTADRIAMVLGGGLILLGIVVMGLINELAGAPHLFVVDDGTETTQVVSPGIVDGGTVVATPVVSPEIRAYVIALGLLVLAVYAVYKLTSPPPVTNVDQPATPADD